MRSISKESLHVVPWSAAFFMWLKTLLGNLIQKFYYFTILSKRVKIFFFCVANLRSFPLLRSLKRGPPDRDLQHKNKTASAKTSHRNRNRRLMVMSENVVSLVGGFGLAARHDVVQIWIASCTSGALSPPPPPLGADGPGGATTVMSDRWVTLYQAQTDMKVITITRMI